MIPKEINVSSHDSTPTHCHEQSTRPRQSFLPRIFNHFTRNIVFSKLNDQQRLKVKMVLNWRRERNKESSSSVFELNMSYLFINMKYVRKLIHPSAINYWKMKRLLLLIRILWRKNAGNGAQWNFSTTEFPYFIIHLCFLTEF